MLNCVLRDNCDITFVGSEEKTNQINEWYYMGHEGVKRFLYLKLYQKHRRRRKISLKDI